MAFCKTDQNETVSSSNNLNDLYSMHLHNIFSVKWQRHHHSHTTHSYAMPMILHIKVHEASVEDRGSWDTISASAPLLLLETQITRHSMISRAVPLGLKRREAVLTSFLGIFGVVFLYLDVLKRFILSCWSRVWTFRVSLWLLWSCAFEWVRFCDAELARAIRVAQTLIYKS